MKNFYILICFIFLISSIGIAKPVSKEAFESNMKFYKQNISKVQMMNKRAAQKPMLKSVEATLKMLEKITFPDGSKKEFTYNENGQTIGYKNFKFNETTGTVILSEDNSFSYDNKGNRILQVFNTLMENAMVNTEKDEYEYDAQNREIVHIFSSYSFDLGKLVKYSKTITSYQIDGFKTEEYSWNETSQTWNLESKSEVEIKNDQLFRGTFYAKSEDTGEVIKSMIMEYFYNAEGFVKQILTKAFDKESGQMIDFTKSSMTYDNHGNEIMSVDSMFYSELGAWMAWSKNVSNFNSNNFLTSDEYHTLDWFTFQLAISEKHEYSYTNNQLTQELVWEDEDMDGKLSQSYKFVFTYDNSIKPEDVVLPDSWIEHNDFGDIWGYFQFSFGALSNVKWYQWDYETESLKQYRDATYHYSNTGGEVAVINSNISTLKVGPNPFNNAITVSLPDNNNTLIAIYNIAGKVVYNASTNYSETINTSNWKPGIYMFHVHSGKDPLQITKLVKRAQ